MNRNMKIGIAVMAVLVLSAFGLTRSSDKVELPAGSELVDVNNKPVEFKQFKGKVVFVNNWASWCGPCVAEMPTIQKLKQTLNHPDLVFVMVSYDEKRDKATAFMQKKGYDFDVYFPGEKYPLGTSSIPATFLIDKTGKVLGPHVGMADYTEPDFIKQVESLLAK